MQRTLSTDLARQIRRECGENVFLCYQCQKCSSGCPVTDHFDLAPNQLMRALQLGQKDAVLRSRTIWLCAMCETCAVRCPHDINITRIMDYLKILAQKEGLLAPLPPAVHFNRAALRGIRWFGKMYEAGLMGELYFRQLLDGTLDLDQLLRRDMPLAMKMVRNRKLKLLPSFGKTRSSSTAAEKKDAIGYYPGCSLHGTSREYNVSTVRVMQKLGVPLEEPEGWSCCGSTPAHSTDHYLSVLLPVRNLVAMEQQGYRNITTPCPSCFIRLRSGLKECAREDLQDRLRADIKQLPSPELEVDHLLQTVTEKVGYAKVAQCVVRPLAGMKVVCYYGCIITRPPKITGVRDYEYPQQMDKLLTILGATPLDWSYKTRCCGGSLGVSQLPLAMELSGRILQNAQDVGAAAIVVACPLCQVNLDARQQQIAEEMKKDFHIPILYFTQLMGLAFGLEAGEMEMDRHFVDSTDLLKNIRDN